MSGGFSVAVLLKDGVWNFVGRQKMLVGWFVDAQQMAWVDGCPATLWVGRKYFVSDWWVRSRIVVP